MKNIILLISLTLISFQSFSQTDKYTAKLSELYFAKEYDKVIKYKKGKVKSLESKSLFFKGLAYYAKSDDRNALMFFDLAIDKGPDDEFYYYYKAMTLYYLEGNEKALAAYNKAIEIESNDPTFHMGKGYVLYDMGKFEDALASFKTAAPMEECDEYVFSILGITCTELEDYEESIYYFTKGLEVYKEKSKRHKNCSFNLAQSQQLNGNFEDAKQTLIKHTAIYPKDYHTYAKLIQIHNALNDIEKIKDYKKILYNAYEKGELKNNLSLKYCFDQFEWNKKKILTFESFEINTEAALPWKYNFLIQDENGDIDYSIKSVLDSTQSNDNTKVFNLNLIKNDTLYTYTHFEHNESPDYSELKEAVLKILNNTAEPSNKMGEYDLWAEKITTSRLGSMGTSFETAIPVKSINAEYVWIDKYYPGHKFISQSLLSDGGKFYDVLQIKTKGGLTKDVYFDITSFFGKGF